MNKDCLQKGSTRYKKKREMLVTFPVVKSHGTPAVESERFRLVNFKLPVKV